MAHALTGSGAGANRRSDAFLRDLAVGAEVQTRDAKFNIHASLPRNPTAPKRAQDCGFPAGSPLISRRSRVMNSTTQASRSSITSAIFDVLDPIPFGFFVAALVFDILYVETFTILWVKAAAWLVSIGLLFAI